MKFKHFLSILLVSISISIPASAAPDAHSDAHSDVDFDRIIDDALRQQSIPGVSAIVIRDHRLVYSSGRGLADIESGRSMTERTVMYIGSLSKILTTVLALNQVEHGALAMTDTLDRQPPITVLQLITHRSGLPREGEFDYWFSGRFPHAQTLADYLGRAPLDFEPSTRTRYSNIGFAALGSLVSEAAGQDFEALMRAGVLEPLGMNDSGARGPSSVVASAYSPPGRLIPDMQRPFAGVGEKVGQRHRRMYHDAGAMSPAFGAYSTASDMGQLLLFLLGQGGEDVLSAGMRARMFQPGPSNYGLGLRLDTIDGRRVARHGGWFAAYRSQLLLEPARGIGIVVLANSDSAAPDAIAEDLYHAVARSGTVSDRDRTAD